MRNTKIVLLTLFSYLLGRVLHHRSGVPSPSERGACACVPTREGARRGGLGSLHSIRRADEE